MTDPCVAFCERCGWEGPDRATPAQAAADADTHRCDEQSRVLLVMRRRSRWFALDLEHALGMRPGTIYPLLARLERDRAVESDWDPESGRRRYMLATGEK